MAEKKEKKELEQKRRNSDGKKPKNFAQRFQNLVEGARNKFKNVGSSSSPSSLAKSQERDVNSPRRRASKHHSVMGLDLTSLRQKVSDQEFDDAKKSNEVRNATTDDAKTLSSSVTLPNEQKPKLRRAQTVGADLNLSSILTSLEEAKNEALLVREQEKLPAPLDSIRESTVEVVTAIPAPTNSGQTTTPRPKSPFEDESSSDSDVGLKPDNMNNNNNQFADREETQKGNEEKEKEGLQIQSEQSAKHLISDDSKQFKKCEDLPEPPLHPVIVQPVVVTPSAGPSNELLVQTLQALTNTLSVLQTTMKQVDSRMDTVQQNQLLLQKKLLAQEKSTQTTNEGLQKILSLSDKAISANTSLLFNMQAASKKETQAIDQARRELEEEERRKQLLSRPSDLTQFMQMHRLMTGSTNGSNPSTSSPQTKATANNVLPTVESNFGQSPNLLGEDKSVTGQLGSSSFRAPPNVRLKNGVPAGGCAPNGCNIQ